jgi:hypothetical protein
VKMFPILMASNWESCPREISWEKVVPFEAQAIRNHGQSWERLAERGGLSASELRAIVEGKSLDEAGFGFEALSPMRVVEDIVWLTEWLK